MTNIASKTPAFVSRIAEGIAPLFKRRRRRILFAGDEAMLKEVGEALTKTSAGRAENATLSFVRFAAIGEGDSSAESIVRAAKRIGAREVAICRPAASLEETVAAAGTLTRAGLKVHVLSDRLSRVARHLHLRNGHMAGHFHVCLGGRRGAAGEVLKRAVDILLSVLVLLALLPLWALLVPVLLFAQGRPVVLRQRRVGRDGRGFFMYKFRTMYERDEWPPADELKALNTRRGPMFKARNDPRVTGLGKWLRRFCIDETPQILNVLAGDMSLVGARPPLPEEVERYRQWHHERFCGPVGITGLWQISDRSSLDFDDVVFLDFYYTQTGGLLLDMRILAWTVAAVLSGRVAN